MLLRRKHNADYVAHLGGINHTDLAMDCIAELFRRNESGSYVALKAYFGSFNIAEADDAELAVHLRRLVSSAVNQTIFGLLGALDPGLSKIIRNIKGGIVSLRTFDEMEVRGEACIAPILTDPLLHLPFIESDSLTSLLIESFRGGDRTPHMLAALACVLRDQVECTRAVPLVRAAMVFREVFALKESIGPSVAQIVEPSREAEFHLAIDRACKNVYQKVEAKYLDTKGLPKELLDSYFQAVRHFMVSRLDARGEEPTLLESLRTTGLDVGREDYRRLHRQRLEYLAHLVKRETKRIIGE
jgi:hypothetical protein